MAKIYFLFIRNIYFEAYEEHLKNKPRTTRILSSIYFFLYVIFYTPVLLIKVWKERIEINKVLEKNYRERIFEYLLNIKKVFPELSEENANYLSNGIGYGFLAFYLNEIFPKFQSVSEKLIENGWFINGYFKINIKGDPDNSIYSDNFNIEVLRTNIKEIESLAICRFPQRAEYLKLAFCHLKSKDYVSSISVLLPQIDGVFRELTSKDLFSKVKKRNPTSWLDEIEKNGQQSLSTFFLSPLRKDEFFGSNLSNALEYPKFISRNRILHGDDLEMNDETKSFKAISLLLYIISIVYDAVNEDENNPRLKDYYNGMEELKNRL